MSLISHSRKPSGIVLTLLAVATITALGGCSNRDAELEQKVAAAQQAADRAEAAASKAEAAAARAQSPPQTPEPEPEPEPPIDNNE